MSMATPFCGTDFGSFPRCRVPFNPVFSHRLMSAMGRKQTLDLCMAWGPALTGAGPTTSALDGAEFSFSLVQHP